MLTVGCARVILTVPQNSNEHNPILEQTDANGVGTWAIVPASYDRQKAAPWIIYNHGFGQTINSITTNLPQSAFVQSLASAGFVVIASDYRNLACWGDIECANDIANLQLLWRSQLNLASRPFVIGESMGGIVTWNAISHGTLKPLAVVGIYPVCNLAAMYRTRIFAPSIQTAYGFTISTGYLAATSGFDPTLTPPSTFVDIPIQMWASYSDKTVIRQQNEDPFARAINAAGGSVAIFNSHGDHGDASNFDALKVISFFSSHRE
jgi:acetyl esterase/lipase